MTTEAKPSGDFYGVNTMWSTIIRIKDGDADARRVALERLLARYRRPILLCIRAALPATRRDEAEDLAHEFIARRLLTEKFFAKLSPEHGRFREWCKTCIANFLSEKHRERTAGKRGGGQEPLSLDHTNADGRATLEPADDTPAPGVDLDREWALNVLDHALESLDRECADARRSELFAALKGHLDRAPDAGSTKDIATRLGMAEGAVYTALTRMRKRLGELISEEVRQTVGTREDWREELKYLVSLLGQG